ncbi:MAG: DUF4421 family protein [Bacteroidales bacterium]|nr:DUF4421 family protein [Bacteroidales bacterium]
MVKKFVFLFLIVACCCVAVAQDEEVAPKKAPFFKRLFADRPIQHDTSYFTLEQHKLLLRGYEKLKFTGFDLYVPENKYFVNYSDVPENIFGLGFNYKWIGLNLGYAFPFLNPKSQKVKDNFKIDLQLQLLVKNWILEGSLHHLQGYYLRKTSLGIDFDLDDNPKILFDALSINGIYVFNHTKFSYKAPFINNAIQKKSAGSLMMGASLYYYRFQTDDNLFPNISLPENDTVFVKYNKVSSLNAFFVVCYGYTFAFHKKWFLNLTCTPGIGLGNSIFAFGDKEWNKQTPAFEVIGRTAFGYNTDRYFVCLSGYFLGIYKELPNGFNWNYAGNLRLSVGIKLNVKKNS